jgi:four helix bundle protein
MGARTYRELEAWQLCEQIRVRVTAETERGKAKLDLRFCDQLRSAAEDAASNLAEGFVRFHPRVFAQFIGYALSSLAEIQERTRHGHDRGYFSDTVAAELVVLCVRADKAARSLRQYLWSAPIKAVPYDSKSAPRRIPRTADKKMTKRRIEPS